MLQLVGVFIYFFLSPCGNDNFPVDGTYLERLTSTMKFIVVSLSGSDFWSEDVIQTYQDSSSQFKTSPSRPQHTQACDV